jgi:hypothetical protein
MKASAGCSAELGVPVAAGSIWTPTWYPWPCWRRHLWPSGRPSRRWAAWNRSGRGHRPPGPRVGVRPGVHHSDVAHQVGERQIGARELVAEVVGQQLGGVLTGRRQAGEQIIQMSMVDPLEHLFSGAQRAEVPDHTDLIRWAG